MTNKHCTDGYHRARMIYQTVTLGNAKSRSWSCYDYVCGPCSFYLGHVKNFYVM